VSGLGGILLSGVAPGCRIVPSGDGVHTKREIGYTEFQTNLPGGRHANNITMRACVVRCDGTKRCLLAPALAQEPNSWTQFVGWSPDGRLAVIGRGWESPDNAAWEEEHRDFRFTPEGWLYDMFLLELATGRLANLTAVERVSFYNSGLFFWPRDPRRLGFTAIIGRDSHPFSMDIDGRNKRDLTADSKEFSYGFSASPNGKRIAYHRSYQIYLADADGGNAAHVDTGKPFNFAPQWSPDGLWVLFVAGEHYDCHPHVVRHDGTGLRQIADRRGHRGVIQFLDVPDFHGGSSDIPAWSADGAWVYYTALEKGCLELMRVSLDGQSEQLTHSSRGALNYQPSPSRDGRSILFGSNRTGTRQLCVMPASGGEARAVTHVQAGHGAMWPHWRPNGR
jgi:Tol biopolymer transport system component